MLRDETTTVLPFRDAALRRPIDVVAWMNTYAPSEPEPVGAHDNVIPFTRLSRSPRRGDCRTWVAGPPEGDAA
jgi:hypothetical protein